MSWGKVVKYEAPLGSSLQIDVPPTIREKVLSPDEPLFITEGIRKADSAVSQGVACVALLGVYGWKQREEFRRQIPLRGRTIYIAFDSGLASNRQVRKAAAGLFAFLESMGAKVFVIALPELDGKKTGLDDYFAAGQSVESLISLASDKAPSFHSADSEAKSPMYEADDTGRRHQRSHRPCCSLRGHHLVSLPQPLSGYRARTPETSRCHVRGQA